MLNREDYEEFCSCSPTKERFIPVYRVLEKLDGYFSEKKFDDANRLLNYWIAEAESISDDAGKLLLLNECVGFYRKLGKGEKALEYCEKALEFLCKVPDAVMQGTTFLNVATAFKAFGKNGDALDFYEKAKTIYEENLQEDDDRLGGLYNNMATAVLENKDYNRAQELFLLALEIMEKNDNTEAEQAITYCNLADLASEKSGKKDEKQIKDYLEKAYRLLISKNTPAVLYACEKCADVFKYYGFSDYAEELSKRAQK